MSIIIRRTIAVLAVLMLAGATVGCDREASDDGVTMGNPGPEQDQGQSAGERVQPGQMGQQDEMAQQEDMEQQGRMGQQEQPGQMGQQDQAVQETQEQVADELGIPANAVVIDAQVRQNITDANSEIERRGWATVSTVEDHLTRLNMDNLEQEESQAATELQQQIAQAEQSLQQIQQAAEEEAEELESNLEDQLSEISDNWDEISDKMQFENQPAGGGPLDEIPGMDNQQESDQQMDNQQMDNQQNRDNQPQNY